MYRLIILALLTTCLSCGQAKQAPASGCLIPGLENEEGVECGTLNVPENRNNPDSRQIQLAYVVLKATSSNPKPDPIVYLQGGPGGSASSTYTLWVNSPLRRDRDFILIDQRGTGFSSPVCEDLGQKLLAVIAENLTPEQEAEALLLAAENCKKEMNGLGVDQGGYNTIQNAQDLDDLRKHLGYKQWNLFGGSYGSRLALAYMRDFPKFVRSSTMLGMFPPQVNLYGQLITNFKSSLFKVFEACQNDPDCNADYPDLKPRYFKILAKLKDDPFEFSYNNQPFTINQQDMLLLTHQLLYTRQTIAQVPSFIRALEDRDGNALLQSVNTLASRADLINIAMNWSFNAFDEHTFAGQEALEADLDRNPELKPGPAFFISDNHILSNWHKHRAPAYVNEPVRSDIPSLVANGAFDPVTPPAYAREATRYLFRAYYMEFPTNGHSTFNQCFFNTMEAFLNSPDQQPDLSCAARARKFNWR